MARRRASGEGSIFYREDRERWVGIIDLGWINGKRQRKSVFGKTQKEVREKMAALRREQERGVNIAVKSQTVEQYLKQWLSDVVQGSVRPRTYESYESTIRKHVLPTLGRIELTKLTPQHVQALLQAKKDERLSPRSVANVRAVLRAALNQALEWEIVGRNAAKRVKVPKIERTRTRIFTPEEANQFLRAIEGDRWEGLFGTALLTGLRQGELLGLHWSDVDLDAGKIQVRYSLQRINGKLTLVAPKTEESQREVSLASIAVDVLRQHRVRQLEERLKEGTQWKEQDLVFPSSKGTPAEKSNINKKLRDCLERAGLPPMRFHDLRHCYPTLLLRKYVHPKLVQDQLGHTQLATTMDLYSHVIPESRTEVAAAMDDLLTAARSFPTATSVSE
jgi:integrase